MALHLLRHADAVPESSELADESRYLSARGREQAAVLGATLVRLGFVPTAVVSSPLVRAVQTAELLVRGCAPKLVVSIDEGLAPQRSLRRLLAGLGAYDGAILVGHEPSISALACALTQRSHFPAFKKAQLLCIEGGEPRWMLGPGDSEVRPYRP